MKNIKKLIAICMASMLTMSSVSVVSATDTETFTKKGDKEKVLSQSANPKAGSLVKRTDIPSESIKVKRSFPTKYSSVDKGYVTSVKNQKTHNTCWTFSAMATMETALLKNGYGTYDLSEEHLDSWTTTRSNGTGWLRELNDGGYSDMAMGYFASWQGARKESDIPFGYATGKTFAQVDSLGTTEYGVTDIIKLPNDIETIKTAIMDYGAVSANYAANEMFSNSDETATYAYKVFANPSQIEGHAITVVGWNDNYSKTNFKSGYQPVNNGAWLCKNSWGDYNSLDGYFWISYEDAYLFDTNFLSAPFAIKDFVKIDDNTKLYQVEEYGATYDFSLILNDEDVKNMTYINKFDFTEKYGNLDSVMFETLSVGADYTIYYIPLDSNGEPSVNEGKWTKLASGVVDYSGYINVETDYELPYSKGAIGVRIDGSSSGTASALGCDEWLTNSTEYVFIPDTKSDVSYLQFEGEMYELTDFYSEIFDDEIGSNFVIKAITSADSGVKKYDVNNDGRISTADAIMTQRGLVEILDLTRNQTYSADTDSNGQITLSDAIAIQKKIITGA